MFIEFAGTSLRAINKETMEDCYELPNINQVTDKIKGINNIFSALDFSCSFYQVPDVCLIMVSSQSTYSLVL